MKKDSEVQLYMRERRKGKTQEVAAAKAGMSTHTGRKYEQKQALPSQIKQPHTHRTRLNPFEEDWSWVVAQLERDPALQGTTLFALMCEKHPGRYQATQVRTLQRHIANWRALCGPEKEIIFAQVHQPGRAAQSDFTHMEDLAITVGGEPFPHLLYHLVLTYSNVEAVSICLSETFEALAEGLEKALWQIGGVPKEHRTDHLSAAIKRLDQAGRETFTDNYQGLMNHYGMQPTWNNVGIAHENGDVEQSHFRFKQALDQALRVRGSRDFVDQNSYQHFLEELVRNRNLTRSVRFATERKLLNPLPTKPLEPSRELRVMVSRFSTIQVLANTYSVPSRLIGSSLKVRIHSQRLEVYLGSSHTLTLPRLLGQQQQLINYRHLIWSLVRKPGAFADYRYREELFPGLSFRQSYDRLQQSLPGRAAREYLRILHLAATFSEAEVSLALGLLLEAGRVPTFELVGELVRPKQQFQVREALQLNPPAPHLQLAKYDLLLSSGRVTSPTHTTNTPELRCANG